MCREPEETKEGGEEDGFEPEGFQAALPAPAGAVESWGETPAEAAGYGGGAAVEGFEAAGEWACLVLPCGTV